MKSVIPIIAIASLSTTAIAADKDWNFGDGEAPERWSLQNADYALCDVGLMQSPIDLAQPKASGDISVTTNYGLIESKLTIAEEKLQLDFPAGMGMQSGDKQFNLLQVHFHTPSEHAIDGERLPLVAHFVHATEQGELGVLGILFKEGETNPALAQLTNSLVDGGSKTVTLDIAEMIPNDLSVFRYMGSLTTPPCSEGVNWHVASQTMEASADQISEIRELLGPTARSIQTLGNRLLVAPAK